MKNIKLERKDVYWLLTTLLTVFGLVLFFVNPFSPRPPSGLLSVEFHRIKAEASTPLIFKMMEGAILEFLPDWSSFDRKQFMVKDEAGKSYGMVEGKFNDIWKNWPFKNHNPVGSKFWNQISGNLTTHNYVGFLNAKSKSRGKPSLTSYAKNYICFYYFSSLNEDGEGYISDSVSEKIYGLDKSRLCQVADYDPYGFFYTAVTIENNTNKIIKNVEVQYSEKFYEPINIETMYPYLHVDQKCKALRNTGIYDEDIFNTYLACERDAQIEFIETTNKKDKLTRTISHMNNGSISILNPGDKIFFLLNAYKPNSSGLPGEHLLGEIEIKSIKYNVEGFEYVENKTKPLGAKRLGIISTASGGIGGQ